MFCSHRSLPSAVSALGALALAVLGSPSNVWELEGWVVSHTPPYPRNASSGCSALLVSRQAQEGAGGVDRLHTDRWPLPREASASKPHACFPVGQRALLLLCRAPNQPA